MQKFLFFRGWWATVSAPGTCRGAQEVLLTRCGGCSITMKVVGIHSTDLEHSGTSLGCLGGAGAKVFFPLYLRPDPVLGGRGSQTLCVSNIAKLSISTSISLV